MKRFPECTRDYYDSLSFYLEDGTSLVRGLASKSSKGMNLRRLFRSALADLFVAITERPFAVSTRIPLDWGA